MCEPRSGYSRMGSLGYERSLICFYTHLNQEVSNFSVEDKQATSVVIGALKMKRNTISLYLIDRRQLKDYLKPFACLTFESYFHMRGSRKFFQSGPTLTTFFFFSFSFF